MKTRRQFILHSAAAFFFGVSGLRAEDFPTLERFVSECVLIVKARQVGPIDLKDGAMLSFEVVETWRGHFDPGLFKTSTPEGYLRAGQGEHGVRIVAGQEVVFFYTRHNQPEGKLARHNAAFSITDGKVVYGSFSNGSSRTYGVSEFQAAIAALAASYTAPGVRSGSEPMPQGFRGPTSKDFNIGYQF